MAKKGRNAKCYMCGKQAVNREHVPPRCFFPSTHNDNLVTVPSCEIHNNQNTLDVEYVRNIVVTHIKTNSVARQHFKDKVLRSYKINPDFKNRVLKNAKEIRYGDYKTGVVEIELERYKHIMSSIAYGIYFKTYSEYFKGDWAIETPSLTWTNNYSHHSMPIYFNILKTLNSLNYQKISTPHVEIFECGTYTENERSLIYKFVFYGGFIVYAVSNFRLF